MAAVESTTLARRRFLVGAMLTIAGGLSSARALSGIFGSSPSLPSMAADDLGTQIWLGERYLELRPDERSADRLYRELVGIDLDSCSSRVDGGELLRRIRHRRAADFRQGDLVILDGWLLARTDARVFALAAVGTTR